MEIDVTDWAAISRELAGRDEDKLWLGQSASAPRAEQWLWKPRRRTGDGTVWQTNDAAEVISSRLAWSLGLPAADCRYAVRQGQMGVISHNVTPPGFELHDGATFLSGVEGYVRHPVAQPGQRGQLRRDEGYTLEAVEQVLHGVIGPPGWGHVSAFELFTGYLVLDALIANTDRHPQNWALLVNEQAEDEQANQILLSPTFDHGSALGSGLSDQNRSTALVDLPTWCARGKSNPFTPRESLLDLARRSVERSHATWWLDSVANLDVEQIRETIATPSEQETIGTPSKRLSVAASTFIEQVLMENKRRLSAC